jgi:uncharacterized protein
MHGMRTLEQVHLKENDRQAAVEAAAFLKHEFPVEQVVLFGSKARGDDREGSDLDLLILTRGQPPKNMSDSMWKTFGQIEARLDVLLSTLIVPREQWEHGIYRVMLLRQEVERDGVLL